MAKNQLTIHDIYKNMPIPENLYAVSKIFARAATNMNFDENKTFAHALTHIQFTAASHSNIVTFDSKPLGKILGINYDPNHFTQDLKRKIGELPKHSYISVDSEDKQYYESGVLVTNIAITAKKTTIVFNPYYMNMFTNLERDYITLWSGDINRMQHERTFILYERIRLQITGETVGSIFFTTKNLKDLFHIPKTGPGSYMRTDGHFSRSNFETKVLNPICADLAACKMITLKQQENGLYYKKIKKGNQVQGYLLEYIYNKQPQLAKPDEKVKLLEEIEADPLSVKAGIDYVKGKIQRTPAEKQKSKSSSSKPKQHDFQQRTYTKTELTELERQLLLKNS